MEEGLLLSLVEDVVRRLWGASATVGSLAPLAGDASTRRYLRVFLHNAGPPSAVIMVTAENPLPLSSEELSLLPQPLTELPYVNLQRFLAPLGVSIPQLYYAAETESFLLLEDIGNLSLWEAVQGQFPPEIFDLYCRAIDQLLVIHVEGTRHRDNTCIAFQQVFDRQLFTWECEHFIKFALEKRLGRTFPVREGEILRNRFGEIARRLDAEPKLLSHRDYHSWNLFLHQGRIRVIDFQDALLAPAQYDLASLLTDRETSRVISGEMEKALVNYYLTEREAREGKSLDGDTFFTGYLLAVLQRAIKVVGRFYYLELEKGKRGYLRYIPPVLGQIRRTLDHFSEYADMREILGKYFPEVR